MRAKITDGHTEDGTRIEVWHDPEDCSWVSPYGKYEVRVDGLPVEVTGADRLRDGGTTFLTLEDGKGITYPRRLHNPERTPRYDKQPIQEIKHG